MATGALIVGGVAAGTGALMSYLSNRSQSNSADKALRQQQAQADRSAATSTAAANIGSSAVMGAGQYAGDTAAQYGGQAVGELQQGRDYALGQMLGYGNEAQSQLAGGYNAAIGSQQQAVDAMGGLEGSSRLNAMLDDPGGYQAQDPGYQFRQQQGEQAINRANAAQGGRYSGRAAKELAQFNSGLASQEFGASAQRATAADQASLARAGGTAGAYGNLAGLQAGQGMAAANQATNQGNALAGLFTGTGSQLANAYQNTGAAMGNAATGAAGNYANALAGNATTQAGISQGMIPAYSAAASNAGGGWQAASNLASDLGGLAVGYAGYQAGQGGPTEQFVVPDQPGITSHTSGTGYT